MGSPNSSKYIGKRIAATVLDYSIVYALTFYFIMMAGTVDENGTHTVTGWLATLPLLFWFLYFIVCESFLEGTLGHVLFKIHVVSIDGKQVRFEQIVLRRLADIIEISWCFGLIAFFIATNTQNNQRLGDLWAKTIVIGRGESLIDEVFDFDRK